MTNDRSSFTMRLPTSDYGKLKVLAKKNKRSMAAELEYILEQYFEHYELQNGIIKSSIPVTNNQVGNDNLFVNNSNNSAAVG